MAHLLHSPSAVSQIVGIACFERGLSEYARRLLALRLLFSLTHFTAGRDANAMLYRTSDGGRLTAFKVGEGMIIL